MSTTEMATPDGLAGVVEQRSIPEPNSGCWLWTGNIITLGYGTVYLGRIPGGNSQYEYAHRISYEQYRGPIAPGLQIDHLCRVRSCVNPRHLEAVTQKTNILRGESMSAQHAKKTTCPQGHPYDLFGDGSRRCRTCRRRQERERRSAA